MTLRRGDRIRLVYDLKPDSGFTFRWHPKLLISVRGDQAVVPIFGRAGEDFAATDIKGLPRLTFTAQDTWT